MRSLRLAKYIKNPCFEILSKSMTKLCIHNEKFIERRKKTNNTNFVCEIEIHLCNTGSFSVSFLNNTIVYFLFFLLFLLNNEPREKRYTYRPSFINPYLVCDGEKKKKIHEKKERKRKKKKNCGKSLERYTLISVHRALA